MTDQVTISVDQAETIIELLATVVDDLTFEETAALEYLERQTQVRRAQLQGLPR